MAARMNLGMPQNAMVGGLRLGTRVKLSKTHDFVVNSSVFTFVDPHMKVCSELILGV